MLLDFHDALLDRRDELRRPAAERGRQGAAERDGGGPARRADRALLRADRSPLPARPSAGAGIFPLLTRIDRRLRAQGSGRASSRPGTTRSPWPSPTGWPPWSPAMRSLLKPDHADAADVALAAVELLREVGLPDDLWQVVNGPGDQVGPAADRRRSTTSASPARPPPGARSSPGSAPSRLIGCSLELGGKNPLLVLDDADVETAAEGAVRACFSNAGQLCVSTERIYVAEPLLHDAFTTAFVAATRRCGSAARLDYEHDMGSLINADQLDRVERARRGRPGQGRHRAHRRSAPPRSGTARSTSRPCSPASPRRWTATPARPSDRWSASIRCATTPRRSSGPTTPSTA